jgi:adenylosuccinate lyase
VRLGLVEAGITRDDAYRIVQRNAMQAWETQQMFRSLLAADPDVSGRLSEEQLDACFSLERALVNVGRTFDALDEMEQTPLA